MDYTALHVIECGTFDSRVKYPVPDGMTVGGRTLKTFELERITEPRESCAYIDGTAYPRQAGMLLLAKPGATRHSQLHFRCSYVHFSVEDPVLRALLLSLPDVVYPSDPTACLAEFQELLRIDPSRAPVDALRFEGAFCVLLAKVVECMREDSRPVMMPGARRNRAALAAAADWMTAHAGERIRLAEIAAQAHLSPTYFHKLFTASFGVTPNEYLLRRRLERAKRLLEETDLSLVRIAEECGFSSQSYFGKQFHRIEGMSPARYRSERLGRLEL